MRLQLDDIHKRFGENEVLRGIDLSVESGQILALVGENGAGKSTLTRVISGAHQPNAGVLIIDGDDVRFNKPQDAMGAGIRVIYQEFRQNLFPHLDVAQNLFVLDLGGRFGRLFVRRGAMREAAKELLLSVGLDVDTAREVASLSVAEQQQLEIAKAISEDVKLLILDEPTAALDARAEYEVFLRFSELVAGRMAVLISHRFSTVRMADRIIVLSNGAVEDEGTHKELVERGGLYEELFSMQAAGYK